MSEAESESEKQPQRPSVTRKSCLWLVYLAPFFITAGYVARFGVNVPFTDEWGIPYLLRMVRQGSHSFSQVYWTPLNEHRMVFPKLLWVGLGRLSNFNVKLNMFVSLSVALATYLGIIWLAKRRERGDQAVLHATVLTTGVVMFSLVHYDTWLMGFQINFVAAVCFGVAAILLLSRAQGRPVIGLALAAACCFLASFSSGQGLVSWLAILPSVFFAFRRDRRLWACLAVLGGFALTCVVYRIDYHPATTWRSDPSLVLKRPWQVISFALALLGAPFCQAPSVNAAAVAPWLGGIFCVGFMLLAGKSICNGRVGQAAPWLSIGLLGLGSAALTTFGRAGWGVPIAATLSRYMFCTIWLPIAVVFLLGSLTTVVGWRRLFFAAAGVMMILHLGAYGRLIHKGQKISKERSDAALFLEVEAYIDKRTDRDERSLLFPLFPLRGYTAWLRAPVELLGEDGFRKIQRHATFPDTPPFGGCFELVPAAGQTFPGITNMPDLIARGWAILPEHALPKIVLISIGDDRAFIAGARVGTVDRPDAARSIDEPALRRCGWQTTVAREFLPAGKFELKAWAYDAEHSRFLQLTNCNGPK